MNPPASPRGDATAAASRGGPEHAAPRRHRKARFKGLRRIVALLLVLGLTWLGWSVGSALRAPGNDSVAAKLAGWGRDHALGPVVTWFEAAQYQASPPKIGGTPSVTLAPPASTPKSRRTPLPAPLGSPAGTPLRGEGAWRVLEQIHGTPAILGAFLRPDRTHTSYLAGIVSMNARLLRFQLHPGESDPGAGNWGAATSIPPGARKGLMATFNGGFKINEAGGGFYLNGATKGVLQPSAASLVFHRDGQVAIGAWGRDVGMGPGVVGVRQNLRLIVDHGTVPAAVDTNAGNSWGRTLGGGYFVWRSGAGMTRDGRLVFVYGPALSARTLADLLQRAGCVEGMQLDINPAWMSYMYYSAGPDAANPVPHKLLSNQERPASRYFSPASRDFIAAFAR
ncbi:MAG TPA: phosphodiester glycosidase family protein [Kribbella sp.]